MEDYESSDEIEQLLKRLRYSSGLSVLESIKYLVVERGQSLALAKKVVLNSSTWSAERNDLLALHEQALAAFVASDTGENESA
jgi:hypothetical protein